MTSTLSRDLIFLVLQFLDEEKFKGALHNLEKECGLFFNLKYFEELVLSGSWDETEKYLFGFTRVDDNRYSMKIFFEIRKQKYLEALDKLDRAKAVDILTKDLKVFSTFNEDLFKEMTQLLTLDNFRDNDQLVGYRDTKTARAIMLVELKKLIEANPLLRDKLQFPTLKNSRLRMLINQSLNWQHSLCPNPRQTPDIRTLFVDHSCRNSNNAFAQLNGNHQLMGAIAIPKAESHLPISSNGPLQSTTPAVQTPLSTWMSIPTTGSHPAAPGTGIVYAPLPKGPGESSDAAFQMRFPEASDRIVLNPGQSGNTMSNSTDEFPKTVARILCQGSVPTSMDFHSIQQTLLLVGTNVGDITLWEVSSGEKLVSRSFQVWDTGAISIVSKAALTNDPSVSVKRILWTPDGNMFGVAYSKHMMHLYRYHGGNEIMHHLEIEAHIGSVNDLAFSNPNKQRCAITCGDDKTIKVWDVATGAKLFTFEGHAAPVYSVCPHNKENVHFVFSTSIDGKIKAWLYGVAGPRVDYEAPGRSCATMAYTADGKRLFTCGTSKDGETHVVEWNEHEGSVKRAYQGFHKHSSGVVQFDTTRNRFLAVGDDYSIKVWDIDNVNLLTTIDAEGDLPASPRISFNKDGTLLAVSANENRIKILATADGLRLTRTFDNRSLMVSNVATEILTMNGDTRSLDNVKPRSAEESNASRGWRFIEISEAAQLRSLRLPPTINIDKISRLIYTNSGTSILALASNALHLLWKWLQTDQNLAAKATTKVAPQLMQPTSGILMTNDLTNSRPEASVPCFALSKNDSYVMSASGGKISLFNIVSFKTMATFMSPPPTATYLAFHPKDNNIIAVGMDDSTINIYNVRVDQIMSQLKGHSKRITGLAFSSVLDTLVSAGADAQIVSWNSESWERQKSSSLQLPEGRSPAVLSDTQVQFHQDQTHFLVVHETQLSIFEVADLKCIKQWVAGESSSPISHATYSCNSQLIYAGFLDGVIRIFDAANFQVRCQINRTAYLPTNLSGSGLVFPQVVAAHPHEPNQFAVGLTDGAVVVFEPPEAEGRWSVPLPPLPPAENGLPNPVAGSGSEQPQSDVMDLGIEQ